MRAVSWRFGWDIDDYPVSVTWTGQRLMTPYEIMMFLLVVCPTAVGVSVHEGVQMADAPTMEA